MNVSFREIARLIARNSLQSQQSLGFFIELTFCKSNFYSLNSLKNVRWSLITAAQCSRLKKRTCQFPPSSMRQKTIFQHSWKSKYFEYAVCRGNMYHRFRYIFGICLCSMFKSLLTLWGPGTPKLVFWQTMKTEWIMRHLIRVSTVCFDIIYLQRMK